MTAVKTIATRLTWTGELNFIGKNHKEFATEMDGNTFSAPSPMELLLEAAGGCSAIDVVLILQKMRESLETLEVHLEGERHTTDPKYYTSIRIRFALGGKDLHPEKVARAIQLSISKYCSVFQSLRKDLQLIAEFRLHNAETSEGWIAVPVGLDAI